MGTGGISPCSVCVKDKHYGKKVQGQGYTATNYSNMPTSTKPVSRFAPSSIGSSILKVIKAAAESYSDVAKNKPTQTQQPYDYNADQTRQQMEQQTHIMRQQLANQQRQQKLQEQQAWRNSYIPAP